ncbi:MAG: histone deacetylase family protein [Deltaproteobacteria bacterium]|nr:MAG: histone deacetylase family protein [Deltaproteobacteria bacterium]
MATLSFVYHEDYLTPYYTSTVECPARIKAIYSKLHERFPVARPAPAERGDILRVHASTMVERVQAESHDAYKTALMSAGGAILAVEEAMAGTPVFALVRPPGHHAGPENYWGFCFFNNIAVAIMRLMAAGRIERALVLDLDLHHGDGTEAIFKQDGTVRVVNLRAETRTTYLEVLQHELDSSLEVDVLAVSAGFDTYLHDWGGILYSEDYRTIGGILRREAQRLCQGKCFAVLEGGYYLPDLGTNVLAFCEGLSGL